MSRFNFDAETINDALDYLFNREKQLLRLGYKIDKTIIEKYEWGISVFFVDREGERYQSIYILKQYRGRGIYRKYVRNKIITTPECKLEGYLQKYNIPYKIENICNYYEYKIINEFYNDQKANRSGLFLMNHIDEGLAILDYIGASEYAQRAYCLHPIFQTDINLSNAYRFRDDLNKIDQRVILLTMEYRNIANAYLSTRNIKSVHEITLSPLNSVNDMLIADKIQNYKDFMLYHYEKHPRSNELYKYFKNWFECLGISLTEEENLLSLIN